jgi:hypothetical protein
VGNWEDWADQLRGELEDQASTRAGILENLFFSGDYEAITDWLTEWKQEDTALNSLRKRYQQAVSMMHLERQLNQRRRMDSPGAELLDRTH